MSDEIPPLRREFFEELRSCDMEGVRLSTLVNSTSVDDREQAKKVLRYMMRDGMITTTPGFRYRLATGVTSDT